ncbi:MAG: FapA family protein [Desulfobacterales bacterium]|nr:FapA family protein [Desulfobacterales bacterium]
MTSDIHSPDTASDQPPASNTRPAPGAKIFGNGNKAVITLALKCRLISLHQENFLLDTLTRKQQEFPEYTVNDLFEETNILSEEDIAFLFAVRDHLEMKMLDKKFGELGVANHLVQPESVKRALDIQSEIFKETSKSKLIGDILLENKEITRADKAAILLTQDRIKDELLTEAMNDIAASEIEKLSLNMRFGAIAVKKDFITIDQLNQALQVQDSEVKTGRDRRYLGIILKEMFDLSDKKLDRILKIQKELEKKRLSLELALEKYNSETSINRRLAKFFEYRFSRNKLEAFLNRSKLGFEDIRVDDLKRWLTSVGIIFGLCPDEEISAFLKQKTTGKEIRIAKGIAPEKGRDGSMEFYFDTEFHMSGDTQDPDVIPMVKKGDALAQRIPAEPGKPGKDVSGFTVTAPPPLTMDLNCGEGVIRARDLYLADQDGVAVLYRKRTLFVKPREITVPIRHYTGSIDADLGEEYKGAHLKVEGSVLKNARVRCHNLEVSGNILGQVSVSGDIRVRGNIGPENGEDGSGVEPAQIKAEGDILAGKIISNAIVITGKCLKAPNADLKSTAVQAYEDITVKNIFNTGPRPCVLQTGKAPNLKAEGIDALIRARQAELDQLLHADESRELEAWLTRKLEVKETYLNQQSYLKYILALVRFRPLSGLPALSDKILAAKKNKDKWPDLPELPVDTSASFASFEREFLEETRDMDVAELESHSREQADIKYGMYRAAVNATRRYNREYETRKKIIQDKIAGQESEIARLEETIKKLSIRKDTFLLSQAHKSPPVPPAVRVKSQVAKGTVIKGRHSLLAVDQDMFGVKFTESAKTGTDPCEIIIEGFYD